MRLLAFLQGAGFRAWKLRGAATPPRRKTWGAEASPRFEEPVELVAGRLGADLAGLRRV